MQLVAEHDEWPSHAAFLGNLLDREGEEHGSEDPPTTETEPPQAVRADAEAMRMPRP